MSSTPSPYSSERLITESQQHDPFIPSDWSDSTFNDINWKNLQSSFKNLSAGRQYQLSKFAHNWTPTLHQQATQDNSIDQ
jgi:hypothetical protein